MEPNQPYIPSQMNPAEDQTIGQTPSVGPITYPNTIYPSPEIYTPSTLYGSPTSSMAPFPPDAPKRRGMGTILSALIGALVAAALLLGAFALGHSTSNAASSTTSSGGSASNVAGQVVAPTVAVPATAADLQQTVINVVNTDQPSVVEITGQSSQGEDIGSGDVVRSNGYIVTNDHVVNGFGNFMVTLASGSQLSASVVGEDPGDDLAVLKVSASNLRVLPFANSSKVQVGAFVVALGTPLGLQSSATFGIISALNRTASEASSGTGATLTGLVQTSAPINPGNSGGALVNLQGQLVGIPTLGQTNNETGTQADGIGFAIPSNRISYVVNQLISSGHITATGQGFLGIQGEDVTPQLASLDNLSVQSGVLVAGFSNDSAGKSPAQQAGIQQGDVIVAVNGTQVSSSTDLAGILLNDAPGTKVSVTVARGSSQKTFSVSLGERPANG